MWTNVIMKLVNTRNYTSYLPLRVRVNCKRLRIIVFILGNIKRKLELQERRKEYLEMVLFNEDIERNIRREEAYIMGKNEGEEKGIKQGVKKGMEKGIRQGVKQGMEQKSREMILNMYKDKLSNSVIAKYANTKVSEVEKIISEARKKEKVSL